MNKAFLIGNLTKDVDLRATPSGKAVATFTLAVARRFKKDETDFLNIVVWGELANNCAKYLNKGKQASVIGEIQNRSYDDKNGNKRYITEIIADEVQFLTSREKTAEIGVKTSQEEFRTGTEPVDDEEIPF